MILHIISKSPLQHAALNDALPYIGENDKVILVDDGVYGGISNTRAADKLKHCHCQCFALEEDMQTRGINLAEGIIRISMQDFIELVFTAEKNISWY